MQKRAANGARRPLLLIVSWLNPHDIYSVLTAAPPDARALAAARLPPNLVDDLRSKPFPQRHYLEEDQGKPFVGADREVWRRYRAFYNGLVETVDREIGTVLDAVGRSESLRSRSSARTTATSAARTACRTRAPPCTRSWSGSRSSSRGRAGSARRAPMRS